jgi:predicted glycogen debranching enzyme
MSYLKFDKTLLTNLEQSLPIEYLRTNKLGAYSCTTVTGCNTRKYHGLLVVPIPELDDEHHVLLSSLDETVIQHGAEFNLGIHKYEGDTFAPRGHKYIREFDCTTISTKIYRVGGVILKRESFIVLDECRLLVRYTLMDAHSDTTLRFRPQLAFRGVNELTHRNNRVSYAYNEVPGGISTCLYAGYPTLYMQLSCPNTYTSAPDWNMGVEYPREQVRGYAYKEDLFMPGYFEAHIKKGESIIFSAGTSPIDPARLKALFRSDKQLRTPRDSFSNCLKIATTSNIISKEGREYIIAGYPWFKVRARDTLIALPGTTLAIGTPREFEAIMAPLLDALRAYLRTGQKDAVITEIDVPDIPLWAIWAMSEYRRATSPEQFARQYGDAVLSLVDTLLDGEYPDLQLHSNGLVWAEGDDRAISWMNATEQGRPVTPRTGYLVEFNALWYHALRTAMELISADDAQRARYVRYQTWAELYESNFARLFIAPGGYLYDYVTEGYSDPSVRPNQLWALALDHTPLSRQQCKAALDVVTRELLTPKGIRSLTPQAGHYRPYYWGNATERNYAYHNGAVWPCLFGVYTEAYLKIFKRSGVSFIVRRLLNYEAELTTHCIGCLSEVFDGNPPFDGHGAMTLAVNTAEVLRSFRIVQQYDDTVDYIK